jgi:hypothetical protein
MAAGDNEVGLRSGSAIGERKTLLTRQIAFEQLPAFVLFALFVFMVPVLDRQ